jgi:hypothetical protein
MSVKRFKKGKYLKSLGWKRDSYYDGFDCKYYSFHHKIHGEYQLIVKKDFYTLFIEFKEIEVIEKDLTKSLIDRIHNEFINKGVK